MTTINPEKLALLDDLELHEGGHSNFDEGHCAMEVVSWLADEGFTDAPQCASPVLARYVIRLNDRWNDEQRQALKPYLVRMIGTGGDGKDAARERIAAEWVTKRLLPDWLRLAGMDDQIAALDAVEPGNWSQLRKTLRAVRDAAYDLRWKRRAEIKQKVLDELAKQGKPDAAAAAVAVADAVAVAAAVADAAADAAAAAAADAAAAAVADAAAAAVAAAVAAAAAAKHDTWSAAYWAARSVFIEAYGESPVFEQIRALGEQQAPYALELLDLLIDAREVQG